MFVVGMPWRMELKTALRRMRSEAGLTQVSLGRQIGVEQATVSRWENGAKPEPEHISALKQFAADKGLEFDLSGTTWASPWSNTVGVFGFAGAGAQVLPFNDGSLQEVELDFPVKEGTGAVVVRGASMLPVFEDGDLVGYHREGRPPEEVLGRTCIVRLADGRVFIKKLRRGTQPNLFTLTSSNAEDIEDVAVEWAAPYRFRIPRDEWRKL